MPNRPGTTKPQSPDHQQSINPRSLRLRLGWHPSFEVWGNVALCAKKEAEHRIEIKLFALSGDVRGAWSELYGTARKQAGVH